ncbi:transcription termination/antitermination protein NusG [Bradyrhizobium sp. LLZ17]|uniref:Transcription termination/antitermination protein NusG n=1 Tax=Bradyrhizobium sp. LLZ17 TaxID=3239388 RepID=A0AB39XW37_9BRAD
MTGRRARKNGGSLSASLRKSVGKSGTSPVNTVAHPASLLLSIVQRRISARLGDRMQEPQVSFNGPQWFCLVVDPGCHRQIESALAMLGYRPFSPKVKRWISHARVKKVAERPLLGRYLFVEIDYPRQSFAPIMEQRAVQYAISVAGVPWPMPRPDVEALLHRYMAGEFDEVAYGPVPVGARVAIVQGQFENWLATVTGQERGGKLTLKLLGRNVQVSRVSPHDVRPAFGFDLDRQNPDEVAA